MPRNSQPAQSRAESMVATIERHYHGIGRQLDPRVAAAMTRVDRAAFVPDGEVDAAWADAALPIGEGQTISQPFIVALMTDLLQIEPGARVLEIGCGCGYQAAVLAELAASVFSVEIVPTLARDAARRLRRLGYDNVTVITGNGADGYLFAAPYDGILIAAALPALPPALLDQLRTGARVVAPIGDAAGGQQLSVITRGADGASDSQPILPVRFVPFTGL